MRIALTFLLLLCGLPALAVDSYLQFTNWNTDAHAMANRKVQVTPRYYSNSVPVSPVDTRSYTTDTSGVIQVSNQLSGYYKLVIQGPPAERTIYLFVPNGTGRWIPGVGDWSFADIPNITTTYTKSQIDAIISANVGQTNFPASAITNANWATTNYIVGLSNEFNIFNRIASNSVSSNTFTFTGGAFSGTNSFSPSADGTYNDFVPRDAINAVRATPWLFTATDIRNLCKQTDALYNKNGNNDIGITILRNGTAPTSFFQFDHSFDFISLLYQSWLKEGKGTPTMWNAYSIHASNTFASVPVTNHLIYITPGDESVGWGFTESTFVTGYHVIGSLFRYRACAEMHLLTTAAGQPSTFYTNEMRLITAQLRTRSYDSSRHLFRYGTLNVLDPTGPWNVHDVLGSAFAVSVGACEAADALDISYALADLVDSGVFYNAAPKYVINSETPAWYQMLIDAASVSVGTYQFGGYWPEFTPWCAEAIRYVRPDLSDRLMAELAAHYSSQADNKVPYEWENFTLFGAAMYLDSACMPLEYWTRPLWQLSTNFPTYSGGGVSTVHTENFVDLRGPNSLVNGTFIGNGGGLTNLQGAAVIGPLTNIAKISLADSNQINLNATNYSKSITNGGGTANLSILGNAATATLATTADVANSLSDAAGVTNGKFLAARFYGSHPNVANQVVLGASADNLKDGGIAIGAFSNASGTNNTAVGANANTGTGNNASAFGTGATANFADSTAIGQSAANTKTNQVVLGLANGEVLVPGNLQFATGNGAGLTNIPGAQITGTIADARLGVQQLLFSTNATALTVTVNTNAANGLNFGGTAVLNPNWTDITFTNNAGQVLWREVRGSVTFTTGAGTQPTGGTYFTNTVSPAFSTQPEVLLSMNGQGWITAASVGTLIAGTNANTAPLNPLAAFTVGKTTQILTTSTAYTVAFSMRSRN